MKAIAVSVVCGAILGSMFGCASRQQSTKPPTAESTPQERQLARYEKEAGRRCSLMPQVRKFTVTVSSANVRSAPSLEPEYKHSVLRRRNVIEVVARTSEGEPFYRMISPMEGWVHTSCVQAGIAIIEEEKKKPAEAQWLSASGRIYPGVKIYYGKGPRKRYAGTVVDVSTVGGQRVVLLEMPSGNVEWKDRNALTQWGWVVKSQYEEAKARYFGE